MRMRLAVAVGTALVVSLVLASTIGAGGGAPRTTSLTGQEECNATGQCNLGDLDGSGFAAISLNVGQAEVCWEITVRDITLPALFAHIHEGPAGVAGPIRIFLSPPDASGQASGCTTAEPSRIQDIIDNPEKYYVNVHTSDFPAGAVRGQLSNRGQSD
jgi:hypothetical protein